MRSAIKYDIFKTTKSISTWIILGTVFIFTCASILMTYLSLTGALSENILSEIVDSNRAKSLDDMNIIDWCVEVTSGDFFLLFSLAFSVVSISGEYSSGFIKNIYGNYQKKCYYILSKAILMVIYVILMVIVSYLAVIIICPIAFKSQFVNLTPEFVEYTFAKIYYMTAFSMSSVLIVLLIRRGLIAIIILFGYSFIAASMLYQGINELFIRVFKVDNFDISKYTLIGNISILNLETTWQQYLIGSGIAITILVLSIIIGSVVFKKRSN